MSGVRIHRFVATGVKVLAAGVLAVGCSSSKAAPAPPPQHLWGDLKPIVSVKELMRDMIDPDLGLRLRRGRRRVDAKKGTIEKQPSTDADWDRIRIGAVTWRKASICSRCRGRSRRLETRTTAPARRPRNCRRRRSRPSCEADPVLWNAKIEALRNVGLEVLDIVKRRDVNELWDAAENLDQACENCHLEYWYPGDKALLQSSIASYGN